MKEGGKLHAPEVELKALGDGEGDGLPGDARSFAGIAFGEPGQGAGTDPGQKAGGLSGIGRADPLGNGETECDEGEGKKPGLTGHQRNAPCGGSRVHACEAEAGQGPSCGGAECEGEEDESGLTDELAENPRAAGGPEEQESAGTGIDLGGDAGCRGEEGEEGSIKESEEAVEEGDWGDFEEAECGLAVADERDDHLSEASRFPEAVGEGAGLQGSGLEQFGQLQFEALEGRGEGVDAEEGGGEIEGEYRSGSPAADGVGDFETAEDRQLEEEAAHGLEGGGGMKSRRMGPLRGGVGIPVSEGRTARASRTSTRGLRTSGSTC